MWPDSPSKWPSPVSLTELQQLHDVVYKESKRWLSSLPPLPRVQIRQHFGEFPSTETDIFSLDDGPSWLWWLTAVLPIDKRAQLALLRTTSLRDRLLSVHKFVLAVNKCWTTWLVGVVMRHQVAFLLVIVAVLIAFSFANFEWTLVEVRQNSQLL